MIAKPAPGKPLRRKVAKRAIQKRPIQEVYLEASQTPAPWSMAGDAISIGTGSVSGNLMYAAVTGTTVGYYSAKEHGLMVQSGDTVFMQGKVQGPANLLDLTLNARFEFPDGTFLMWKVGDYLPNGALATLSGAIDVPDGAYRVYPVVIIANVVEPSLAANFDEIILRVIPKDAYAPIEAIGNAKIHIMGESPQLLKNPSFADMSAWTTRTPPPLTVQVNDDTVGTYGKWQGNGTGTEVTSTQGIPVKEGATYKFSALLYGAGKAWPAVAHWDTRKADGSAVAFGVVALSNLAVGWKYFEGQYTVPKGLSITQMTVRVGIGTAGGSPVVPADMIGYATDVFAFGPPEWIDVTPQSMVVKLSWGADDPAGLLTVPAAGGWDVRTYDPDRKLDPANGASPNAASLHPGRPMRIGVETPSGFETVRQGVIDEVDYDLYDKTGSMRGSDVVPLIVAAKLTVEQLVGVPNTLWARARWLINKAGLAALVPVGNFPGELLKNGSFEDEGASWSTPPAGSTFPVVADAISGHHVFQLKGTGGGYPKLIQQVSAEPGSTYTLRGWFRRTVGGLQPTAMISGRANGTPSGNGPAVICTAALGVWQAFTATYTPASTITSVEPDLRYNAAGTASADTSQFDDVTLTVSPGLVDPEVGPLPDEQEVSVWSLLATSAYDALHAMWVDRLGILRFRSFGSPRDNGLQIGGPTGIPIATLKTHASIQNIYTIVRAFDMDAPDVPVLKENAYARQVYGAIPLTREKPVPDAEFWATNVLADRSGSALQYETGTLYPRTADELRALIEMEMIDTVHIVADDVTPTVDLNARSLGARLTADTDTGWTAEVITYIPSSEWIDQEVPPVIPPVIPPVTHQETRYYTCHKDSRAARNSSGTNMGSGTEGELPVGSWQGWRNRAFLAFTGINWTKVKSVDSCILELDTSDQVNVGFGASPKVIVSRVTEGWGEGTSSSPSGSNSLKYPGPPTTSTNQKTASITRSENAAVGIDITAIARDWKNGAGTYGVRIISAGEDSNKYTTEFWSRENSNEGRRPRLKMVLTIDDTVEDVGKPAPNVSD